MSFNKHFLPLFSLFFIYACSQPYDVSKEMLVDTGIKINENGDIVPPEETTPPETGVDPDNTSPPKEVPKEEVDNGGNSSNSSSEQSSSQSSAQSSAQSSQSSNSSVGQEDNNNSSSSSDGSNSSVASQDDDDDSDEGSSSSDSEGGNICDDTKLANHKVDVCHNGTDINISVNGWCNGHSKHEDDTLGKCADANDPVLIPVKACSKDGASSKSSKNNKKHK